MGTESHDILVTAIAALAGGIFLLVLSRRFHIPAIVLLLLGGAAFGSQGLGLIRTESFGDGLLVLVELSVGLILFEGGLTLRPEGFRSAPAMIKRLLTLGVLITWLSTALLIGVIVGLPWQQAVIAASLVIVTGPTVIAPLLKRIRVNDRLNSILKWEAVLIDPIGVFIAVLCFEWLGGDQTGSAALVNLGIRIGVGLGLGLGGGLLMVVAVKRRFVPADLVNIFILACAVLVFGGAEAIISHAGLLAVTVAGFTFGLSSREDIKDILRFKAELTDLLIATLFMLLAARLELGQFGDFGLSGALAVGAVLFIVRPLCINICAVGLGLPARERVFLSWIAPRGIVAASMASLFAISLEQRGVADARFVETFTYSVIVATIVLQGLSAGPLARALRVQRPEPKGWLIVGAHLFARQVARFIRKATDSTVVMVDTSANMVREAMDRGFRAVRADARDVELTEKHQLTDVGNVLALTDNEDLNARICLQWSDVVGPDHVFRCRGGAGPDSKAELGSVGRMVWPSLPRPSVLSGEIDQGTTSVIRVTEGGTPPEGAVLIARDDGGRVRLDDAESDEAEPLKGRALYVRRDTDALQRSIRHELILLAEKPDSMESLLKKMLERLEEACPVLRATEILPPLLERERVFPAVIGAGVAVPHAYSKELNRQFCVIACLDEAVEYLGPDATPVRLVFLLISPRSDPKAHLALLADIARLVESAEVREGLLAATRPIDVIDVIRHQRSGPRVRPARS